MATDAPQDNGYPMNDAPRTPELTPYPAVPPAKTRRLDRRWLLGLGALVAVLALVTFTTTSAFAQAAPKQKQGPMGFGGFGGITAVVSTVDTGASTVTFAGLPQQVNTVKIDSTVKLLAENADGTTKPAAIGDFKTGALVRIGIGRAQAPAATNTPGTPATGNRGNARIAVNQLTLVNDSRVEISGVILANNNGVYTVATAGNQRVTVRTASNTTYTKGKNTAATVAELTVGTRIAVTGTQAQDGITATTVRIMDFSAFGQGGFGGFGGNGGGPLPGIGGPGGRGPGMMPRATTPAASPTARP